MFQLSSMQESKKTWLLSGAGRIQYQAIQLNWTFDCLALIISPCAFLKRSSNQKKGLISNLQHVTATVFFKSPQNHLLEILGDPIGSDLHPSARRRSDMLKAILGPSQVRRVPPGPSAREKSLWILWRWVISYDIYGYLWIWMSMIGMTVSW